MHLIIGSVVSISCCHRVSTGLRSGGKTLLSLSCRCPAPWAADQRLQHSELPEDAPSSAGPESCSLCAAWEHVELQKPQGLKRTACAHPARGADVCSISLCVELTWGPQFSREDGYPYPAHQLAERQEFILATSCQRMSKFQTCFFVLR